MSDKPAIITALDGSETATVALAAAESMTKIMNGKLYILHVAEEELGTEELLEKLKIKEKISITDYEITFIQSSDVVDGVLRFVASMETAMIVISSHGLTNNPEHLVGSVTMGIIQRAINPVMVIRPDMTLIPCADWKPVKMLVPQDGSPTAATVMVQVYRLAELTGAEVDVLNIGSTGEVPTEEGTILTPRYLDYPRYDWPAWASEFVQRFYSNKPAGVNLKLFERKGDPPQVLKEFAYENDNDIITLGWHGQLAGDRARIVKELIRTSEIPLILIWCREQFD